MPTPSAIQRKAQRINAVSDDFCRGKDRCQGCVSNSGTWWQSEAGKELRSQYSEIQDDLAGLLAKLDRLENCTKRLAGNVQRAIDERRRRAEARRRAASAANGSRF